MAIPVFYFIVVSILDRKEALLALLLFVLSEPLIFFSVQVKQYSMEVLACLIVLGITLLVINKGATFSNVLTLLLTGAVSLAFSYTAVFICAGMGLFLIYHSWRKHNYNQLLLFSFISIIWAGTFMALYLIFFNKSLKMPFFVDYWKGFYLAPPPWSAQDLQWSLKALLRYFKDPLYFTSAYLGALLFVIGAVRLLLFNKRIFQMTFLPLLFLAMAIMLRFMPMPTGSVDPSAAIPFPFYGRLILFTVPLVLIIIAYGLGSMLIFKDIQKRYIGVILVTTIVSITLFQTVRSLFSNPMIQEMRPLMKEIVHYSKKGDLYYIQSYGQGVVEYYAFREGKVLQMLPLSFRNANDAALLAEEISQLQYGQRVWLITLYYPTWNNEKEREHILRFISTSTRRELTLSSYGATSDLFIKE